MAIYFCGSEFERHGICLGASHDSAEEAQGCAVLHIQLRNQGATKEEASRRLHPALWEETDTVCTREHFCGCLNDGPCNGRPRLQELYSFLTPDERKSVDASAFSDAHADLNEGKITVNDARKRLGLPPIVGRDWAKEMRVKKVMDSIEKTYSYTHVLYVSTGCFCAGLLIGALLAFFLG